MENKYQEALETLKNEYDAYYIGNKYGYGDGKGTHPEEFELLNSVLQNDLDKQALYWIRKCYDCYYKDELDDESAFAYLEKRLKEYL